MKYWTLSLHILFLINLHTLNIIFMLLVGLPTSQWYIFVLYLKKVCRITMVSIFLWWSILRFSYVLGFLNIDKPNLKGLKSRFKTRKNLYGFEVFHLFWKMCIGTWEPIKCKDMELNCMLYFLVSSNFVQTFQCQWTLCIMHYMIVILTC